VSRRIAGLTVDGITEAALSIATRSGLASLNVRALASHLGVVPSALYKHIRDRDELIDLVVDRVLGAVDVRLSAEDPWQTRTRVLAGRLREALRHHPGVAAVLKGRDPLGPNSDRVADAFARCMLDTGLEPELAAHAWYSVMHYVIGFEATFAADRRNLDRAYDDSELARVHGHFDTLDPGRYPGLVALGRHIWAPVLDERFEAGLQIVIDGVAAAQGDARRERP
jgi:AcrR family transcriptional regulator